jgi:flavin-binding protein dodecin
VEVLGGTSNYKLNNNDQEIIMSVARITELSASSKKSFEDAVENGIKRANETLQNIEGAWVQDMKVKCKDGKISEYRVNLKVTFVLK